MATNSLTDLLALLEESESNSPAIEKSASANVAELSMDQLIKMAEDEGERAAAEMAAAEDAQLAQSQADAQDDGGEDEEDDDATPTQTPKDKENNMDKQAFLKKLADSLTDTGSIQPNLQQEADAQNVAMDDVAVKPTPGTMQGMGAMTQAIMAQAQQAAAETGSGVQVGDGDDLAEDEEDAVTKAAALDSLMGSGYSFDEAANLVKAAADAVTKSHQYSDHEKAAAVGELMAQGIDFDQAVELVKQAASDEQAPQYSDHEKAAAVGELMAQGIDFDQAVQLVKQAADEAEKKKTR
jgi:uncharacterized protein YoaH (UPF0181 family)